ncbi:RNA methyltransferase [Desulfurococcaceae archaeon MEX13E-LK6-19]|nr:RNA methyltransferase [Desulfurococcaceae archaeon MEX13E-LK6-19]
MNIGFVARTCMNFGVEELYIVNPKASLEEARRYSAKAVGLLEKSVIVNTLDEALEGGDIIVATSAKGYSEGDYVRQAVPVREFVEKMVTGKEKIVLLFGRESTGLTREEIKKAQVLVTIPANPVYPVLNLSHAVAIILYELWVKLSNIQCNVPPPAPPNKINEIITLFDELVKKLRLHETKAERIHHIIRSILYRSRLSEYEARLLVYLLRKTLRGLESIEDSLYGESRD